MSRPLTVAGLGLVALLMAACMDQGLTMPTPELSAIDGKPLDANRMKALREAGQGCSFVMEVPGGVKVMTLSRSKLPFTLPKIEKVDGQRANGRSVGLSLRQGTDSIKANCWVPVDLPALAIADLVTGASIRGVWADIYARLQRMPTVTTDQRSTAVASREAQQFRWEWVADNAAPLFVTAKSRANFTTAPCALDRVTENGSVMLQSASVTVTGDCDCKMKQDNYDPLNSSDYLECIFFAETPGDWGNEPVPVTIKTYDIYYTGLEALYGVGLDSWYWSTQLEIGTCGYAGCFDFIYSGTFDSGGWTGSGFYSPNWVSLSVERAEYIAGEQVSLTARSGRNSMGSYSFAPLTDPTNFTSMGCGTTLSCNSFTATVSGIIKATGPDGATATEEITVFPNTAPAGVDEEEFAGMNPREKVECWNHTWECIQVGSARHMGRETMQQQIVTDGWTGSDGGNKYDAIRHAAWSAFLTWTIGPERAEVWTTIHETGRLTGYENAAGQCMDLFNNAKGREVIALNPGLNGPTAVGIIKATVLGWANSNPPVLRTSEYC